MNFKLHIDPSGPEEVIANVRRRTPLIDEIERLVMQESIPDQLPGYRDDDIVMLTISEIECFIVEDEKTFAICANRGKFRVRKRLYELDGILPSNFQRISKSAIANMKKIARFKVQLSGAVDAVFKSGYVECISRRCFAELRRRYDL